MKNSKKGISLIVLVITIIVMVVLAAAVVISLNNTGIINKANDAIDITNLKEVQQYATLIWAEEYMDGKRGDRLKNDVLEKLGDYTGIYDFEIDDKGIEVSKKDDVATQQVKDYFTYEYDSVNMTATLVGVKEQYSEQAYYADYNTNYYFSSAIIDDGNTVIDIVVPSTTVGEDGKQYTVTALNSGVFAPGSWNASEGTIDAFSELPRYKSIKLPDTITTIAYNAFIGCVNLETIELPSNLTTIGQYAFGACKKLTIIELPSSVTSIGPFAFNNCTGLTNVTIPNSVTSIGYGAFSNCTGLTNVTIPNSVTSIGYLAFSNCTSLTNVTIPNSVTTIEGTVFSGCTSLTSVVIPNSVTSIGSAAFSECTSLTNVYYTGTETEWNSISIESYNDPLKNATKHYNHVINE